MTSSLPDFRDFTEFQEFLAFLDTVPTSLREVACEPSPPLPFPVVLQSFNYSCGRACLMAICEHLGYRLPPHVWETLGTSAAEGTSVKQIIAFIDRMGWSYEEGEGESLDTLQHTTAHGVPVMCAVNMYEGSHWVVVYDVDEASVDIMDPVAGLIQMPRAEFEVAWDSDADGKRWLRYCIAIGKPDHGVREDYAVALREAQEQAAAPTAPLAAHTKAAQYEALAHTDGVADSIDRAISGLWDRLTALIDDEGRRRQVGSTLPITPTFAHAVAGIVREIHRVCAVRLRDDFTTLAKWGHEAAASALEKTLPVEYLRKAVEGATGLSEAKQPPISIQVPGHGDIRFVPDPVVRPQHNVTLLVDPAKLDQDWAASDTYIPPGGGGAEVGGRRQGVVDFLKKQVPVEASRVVLDAEGQPDFVNGRHRFSVLRDMGAQLVAITVPRHQAAAFLARYGPAPADEPTVIGRLNPPALPGLIHFGINPAATLQVTTPLPEPAPPVDPFAPATPPIEGEPPDANALADLPKDQLAGLLFPPLTLDRIAAILVRPIAGKTWEQDLSAATKLADPNVVAGMVAGGFAAGKTPAEVARLLEPVVDGVKSSAKRIARTYGIQIAHRAQMDAHQQLGDLVIGYTVHSAFSPNSRQWHKDRSGTTYYLNPGPGQKGLAQMPHPPLEAEDSRERPPGTPRTAWNCMCYLTPTLRDLE